MKRYAITNQRDLREAFWQMIEECAPDYKLVGGFEP